MEDKKAPLKAVVWTGRVITSLAVIFLLVDGIMKIAEAKPSIEGCTQLGWPAESVLGLGLILVLCTALYAVPRTAILGAVLLTGYLGGAVAIMFRASIEGHPYLFPVGFGIFIWTGLFLQYPNLRNLISVKE